MFIYWSLLQVLTEQFVSIREMVPRLKLFIFLHAFLYSENKTTMLRSPQEKLCKDHVIFLQVHGSNYGATPLTMHLVQATPGSHWQRGRQVDVLPADDDHATVPASFWFTGSRLWLGV